MIDPATLDALDTNPQHKVASKINGHGAVGQILIADYPDKVVRHYGLAGESELASICRRADTTGVFANFGAVFTFDQPAELPAHNADMVLDDSIRAAVARFGTVIFRNAYVTEKIRNRCQHNIFPDLRFHFDRGANQPEIYSLYTRNCFDPVEREPRLSSTLFIANIVAILQGAREHQFDLETERGIRGRYDIFDQEQIPDLLGRVVLEQGWNAPAGTGEIAVIDNRTVLHASYYRNGRTAGYPIGTRYLQ